MSNRWKILIAGVIGVICITIFVMLGLNKKLDRGEMLREALNSVDTKATTQNMEKIELTFYFACFKDENIETVLKQVENESKELNTKLNFKFLENGSPMFFKNEFDVALASGQKIDAFQASTVYNMNSYGDINYFAKKKSIMDLTTLLPTYAANLFGQFSDEQKKAMMINNKIWSIPINAPDSNCYCAYVREDLAQKYNVNELDNIEQIEKLAIKIKKDDSEIIPISSGVDLFGLLAQKNDYVLFNRFLLLVYKWNDTKMKLIPFEQTREFKADTLRMYSWYKNDLISQSLLDQNSLLENIVSGKCGILIGDNNLARATELSNVKTKYKAFKMFNDKNIQVSEDLLFGNFAISSNCKNPERVLMFWDWLNKSKKNYASLMFGIKGSDYKLENDSVTITNSLPFNSAQWRFSFYNKNFSLEEENVNFSSIPDVEYTNNIKCSPSTGFTVDYPMEASYARYEAVRNYLIELLSGQNSNIDNFIEEQKSLGIDDTVKDLQNKLDTWKNSN